MITYKDAGVDIKKADDFVRMIKDRSRRSGRGGSIKQPFSGFASIFDIKTLLAEYENPVLVSSCDGVGTKLKIAQEAGIHNTVGIDLVAMSVNDLICLGARPLFFLDYIACGKLNPNVLSEVVRSIKKGLKESNCSLLGGETAEMPGMYKKDEYDLAGFCVGIADKNKIIDGKSIKPGDVIIGLESNGLHSNGFSLVRKALSNKDINKYAEELLKPTRIYVKPVISLLRAKSYEPGAIKGIAHITGGSFYNKAAKIVPSGVGMVIDKHSWPVPEIFKVIQKKGKINDKEMHTVFNMGIGMILVVKKQETDYVRRIISRYKIKTYIIGEIVKSKSKVRII